MDKVCVTVRKADCGWEIVRDGQRIARAGNYRAIQRELDRLAMADSRHWHALILA